MNHVLSIQQSHAEPISMLVDVSRDVDQSEMFQEIFEISEEEEYEFR